MIVQLSLFELILKHLGLTIPSAYNVTQALVLAALADMCNY